MKTLLIACLLCFIAIVTFGQEVPESFDELRAERPWGISANAGSNSIFLGISVTRYVSPRLELDVSFGYALSYAFTTGLTYYFPRERVTSWNTYMGAHIVAFGVVDYSFSFYSSGENDNTDWAPGLYLPIGIQYFAHKGFTFNVEAGVLSAVEEGFRAIPFGGIRIGYRFAKNAG